MAEIELKGSGNSWVIYADGKPASRAFAQISTATAAIKGVEKRLKRAAQPRRLCLCCAKPFPSEGIHNRLCDPCRLREDPDFFSGAFAGPALRTRRRAGAG